MTAMSDGLSKLLLNYIVKDLNAASCFRFFGQQKTYLEIYVKGKFETLL